MACAAAARGEGRAVPDDESRATSDFLRRLHDKEPELVHLCISALGCGRAAARLEGTCKLLRRLVRDSDDAWMAKAQRRFGADTCRGWAGSATTSWKAEGEHLWHIGCNLLGGHAVYQYLDDDPKDDPKGDSLERCGCCSQASCERFVVSGSDDAVTEGPSACTLLVRSAADLSVVKCLPYCHCHHLAIFGPESCPLVALSSGGEVLRVCPIEAPGELEKQEFLLDVPPIYIQDTSSLIGSAACLVLGSDSGVRLHYRPLELETPAAELREAANYAERASMHQLYFCRSQGRSITPSERTSVGVLQPSSPHCMAWAPAFGPAAYVIGTDHGEICLWGRDEPLASLFEDQSNAPHEVLVQGELDYKSIVVTDRYIVAAPEECKYAYVFSHTGERLRSLREPGLDPSDYTDADDGSFIFGLQLAAVGDVLISSSVKGCALCVWDLHTGTLLHRHEEPLSRHGAYILPDGFDVNAISLVRGGRGVCFGLFMGDQHAWHFDSVLEWDGPGSVG